MWKTVLLWSTKSFYSLVTILINFCKINLTRVSHPCNKDTTASSIWMTLEASQSSWHCCDYKQQYCSMCLQPPCLDLGWPRQSKFNLACSPREFQMRPWGLLSTRGKRTFQSMFQILIPTWVFNSGGWNILFYNLIAFQQISSFTMLTEMCFGNFIIVFK